MNGDQSPIQNAISIIIGSFVRTGLQVLATFLVAHKILTPEDSASITGTIVVAAVTTFIISFLWGIYTRLRAKFKLNVALISSKHSPETLEHAVQRASFAQVISTNPQG
jgi:hypothetical protein